MTINEYNSAGKNIFACCSSLAPMPITDKLQSVAFRKNSARKSELKNESLAWIFNKAAPLNGGSRFFHTSPPHDENRYTENTSMKMPANLDLR